MLPYRVVLAIAIALSPAAAAAHETREGGKLVLTNGVSTLEGSAGGGLATWAVIAGNETRDGYGVAAHATLAALPDFDLESYGIAIGIRDRIELSYAHQSFDTRAAGAALGLGRGFVFAQDVYGAKLRVAGDAVWDQDRWLPQIAIGVQHNVADKGAVIAAVGGQRASGTDFLISATKIFLAQNIVADATLRVTRANQFGLLGQGGDRGHGYGAQFEGSLARMLSPSLAIGGEVRSKPDQLGFAREDAAWDLFAAWSPQRHVTLTAAFVDLGSIATVPGQHGAFLSLQTAF
jgi:hypothetical protein